MKQVQIVTDGSCIGNPGPGGWACILRCDSEERELSGGEAQTTNNRMELTAAINGLKALRGICEVEVVTDSQYLKQGVTQYLSRWKINGWRTSDPVLNQDLWRELDDVASRRPSAGHGLPATTVVICTIAVTLWPKPLPERRLIIRLDRRLLCEFL